MLSFHALVSLRTGFSANIYHLLEDCPFENLLTEAVPISLFETCLPLQYVVWLLEGGYKCTGYT